MFRNHTKEETNRILILGASNMIPLLVAFLPRYYRVVHFSLYYDVIKEEVFSFLELRVTSSKMELSSARQQPVLARRWLFQHLRRLFLASSDFSFHGSAENFPVSRMNFMARQWLFPGILWLLVAASIFLGSARYHKISDLLTKSGM